jgi:hypothetical protein
MSTGGKGCENNGERKKERKKEREKEKKTIPPPLIEPHVGVVGGVTPTCGGGSRCLPPHLHDLPLHRLHGLVSGPLKQFSMPGSMKR